MFLCTQLGFFSATQLEEDGRSIVICACNEQHLSALKLRFASLLYPYKIIETKLVDYRYRIIVNRDVWVTIARCLAAEINYSDFKYAQSERNYDNRYEEFLCTVRVEAIKMQTETEDAKR